MEKNKGEFDTFTSGDGPTIPDSDLDNYANKDGDLPDLEGTEHGAIPSTPQKK